MHQRAFLEERAADGEEVEEYQALSLEGFAADLVDAYWMARSGTASDRPVPQAELRVTLELEGLGDRFRELWPAMRSMDRVFLEHAARRRREASEARRNPAPPEQQKGGG